MESTRLVSWLQVGANLSVLLGLILVAIQISQNSDLVRYQLLNEQFALQVSKSNTMMGENPAAIWAKSVEEPDNLSLEEMRVMESMFYRNYLEYVHLYDNQDIYDDAWRSAIEEEGAWFLESLFGRAWWDENKQTLTRPELTNAVEAVLDRENGQLEYFGRIRDRLESRQKP